MIVHTYRTATCFVRQEQVLSKCVYRDGNVFCLSVCIETATTSRQQPECLFVGVVCSGSYLVCSEGRDVIGTARRSYLACQ